MLPAQDEFEVSGISTRTEASADSCTSATADVCVISPPKGSPTLFLLLNSPGRFLPKLSITAGLWRLPGIERKPVLLQMGCHRTELR